MDAHLLNKLSHPQSNDSFLIKFMPGIEPSNKSHHPRYLHKSNSEKHCLFMIIFIYDINKISKDR